MSFKFNFGASSAEVDDPCHNKDNESDEVMTERKTQPCKEIKMVDIQACDTLETISYSFGQDVFLKVLNSKIVEQSVTDKNSSSDIVMAVQACSDLVPTLYEGGLKVWECSIDLVDYLHTNKVDMADKSILELGCGAGLPGIYAVIAGASKIYFQDYNEEVIEQYTIPNVCLNTKDRSCCTRFFSGDWSKFEQILSSENNKFDVILTSETIYEPQNYQSLHSILNSCLEANGTIYLAAKSYYFGVGGGTSQFEEFCSRAGSFKVTATHNINAGVPRKILVLKRAKDLT